MCGIVGYVGEQQAAGVLTRWATHGEPSDINSHPHGNARITIVHNGIIENNMELKTKLLKKGYSFLSETDTEVVAKLLDYYYKGDPMDAIKRLIMAVKGSYALGIMFRDIPKKSLLCAKTALLSSA